MVEKKNKKCSFSPGCLHWEPPRNAQSWGSAPWPWKGCWEQCRWWWLGQQRGPWQSSRRCAWSLARWDNTPRSERCWKTCTSREDTSSETPPTLQGRMKKETKISTNKPLFEKDNIWILMSLLPQTKEPAEIIKIQMIKMNYSLLCYDHISVNLTWNTFRWEPFFTQVVAKSNILLTSAHSCTDHILLRGLHFVYWHVKKAFWQIGKGNLSLYPLSVCWWLRSSDCWHDPFLWRRSWADLQIPWESQSASSLSRHL